MPGSVEIGEARVHDHALVIWNFTLSRPILDSLDLPLGIVQAIAGQSRLDFVFEGKANHAGTTP